MNTGSPLVGEIRDSFGKGAARKYRAVGKTPAVIYGHGSTPRHITVPAKEVARILRHKNAVIALTIDGKEEAVLVKSATKDAVTQIIEHIDLVELVLGERVSVTVPVHVVGESLSGTNIELEHKTLKLSVAATSIPDNIEVRFDKQGAGFQLLAKDLVLPEGATLELGPDELIAAVVASAVAADDQAKPADSAE